MATNELPEAPASVTYSIISKDGFNALFTIREMTGLALIEKMSAIEKKLLELEYKPQVKQVFGQKKEVEYVEGKVCPKDGGKLKIIISKKDGKTYWACVNGHYDYMTKMTTGCNFITTPEKFEQVSAQIKTPIEEFGQVNEKELEEYTG
jgi:hypothetical protein